jgi:hydrogenase nickel incorporation protein HypA/HybF
MHELSIAGSLVEVLSEQLADLAPVARVLAVHLRVGVMSGVVPEALRFSYGIVTGGTRLAGSRLEIESSALVVWCPRCEAEQALDDPVPLCCPACGTPTPRVVRGRELEVLAVEVDDEAPHARGEDAGPQEE